MAIRKRYSKREEQKTEEFSVPEKIAFVKKTVAEIMDFMLMKNKGDVLANEFTDSNGIRHTLVFRYAGETKKIGSKNVNMYMEITYDKIYSVNNFHTIDGGGSIWIVPNPKSAETVRDATEEEVKLLGN